MRARLRRVCASAAEIDDVVQEVYYKVLTLTSVRHILEPRWFLFKTAKNIVVDRMRREAVIRIDARANLQEHDIEDDAPTPERVALARAELRWVLGLIGTLPTRCRSVFRARRVYGLSQTDTAQMLGIPEKAVEYETGRGLKLLSEMMTHIGAPIDPIESSRAAGKQQTANVRVKDR